MKPATREIEAEVVEIDGRPVVAPTHDPAPTHAHGNRQDWRQWQGRIRRIDSRWWPLWVVLGAVVVTVALALAAVLAVIWSIGWILRQFLRTLAAALRPR